MLKLDSTQIRANLESLDGWTHGEDFISRDFKFASFIRAFGWMSSVALVAQSMDHHPDWKNVYNQVWVQLSTHDAGGVTDKDFALARKMNELYGSG